jgi:subtilisin family serine protease
MKRFIAPSALAVLLVVALIAPALAATNDTYRARQWGLDKINAEAAWAVTNGTGAVIAVVDTGADMGHPDLQANLLSTGHDFVANDNNPQDENGHGTHVSGIAAAVTNNGIGVAGTAPGAKILPVRVLDADGSGSTDDVALGIRYAADNGADVINLSLGLLSGVDKVAKLIGQLDPVYDAIDYAWGKGVVVVIAAGNDSVPLCAEPSAHPQALCVGATDQSDMRSFFSNSDATLSSKYLVAPGGGGTSCAGDIFSTYLRSAESFCSTEAGYDALAGTSMATPFVAGVAALLAAKGDTNQQIVNCIIATTDDLGVPGRDPLFGYGRLNAQRAATTC